VNEYDAIDAKLRYERAAREEQEELDRRHGQFLLDVMAARMQQGSGEDPALVVLRRAHQSKAEEG
jgi:hypothetical protein